VIGGACVVRRCTRGVTGHVLPPDDHLLSSKSCAPELVFNQLVQANRFIGHEAIGTLCGWRRSDVDIGSWRRVRVLVIVKVLAHPTIVVWFLPSMR